MCQLKKAMPKQKERFTLKETGFALKDNALLHAIETLAAEQLVAAHIRRLIFFGVTAQRCTSAGERRIRQLRCSLRFALVRSCLIDTSVHRGNPWHSALFMSGAPVELIDCCQRGNIHLGGRRARRPCDMKRRP